jgi:hypothetical protein
MAVEGCRGYSVGSVAQPASTNPITRIDTQALNTPEIRQERFAIASIL